MSADEASHCGTMFTLLLASAVTRGHLQTLRVQRRTPPPQIFSVTTQKILMPRHKQPLELAHLKGSVRANPQRYPAFVPKSDEALGEAPNYMSELGKNVWRELARKAPAGVLTAADEDMFGITCELVALLRTETVKQLPAAKISLTISALGLLGLSPADRQRLGTNEPPSGPNEFDEFL